MARRADHTREELKELAIETGWRMIKSQGVYGFSARKLAVKIDYTVGTLYNIFSDFDDIILNINAKTLDQWFMQMEKDLKKNDSLSSVVGSYIKFSKDNYNSWAALFEFQTQKKLPNWYSEKMNRFFKIVEDLLIRELKLKQTVARRASRVLWAGIHGICILSFSGKLNLVSTDKSELLAKDFLNNYLSGLKINN